MQFYLHLRNVPIVLVLNQYLFVFDGLQAKYTGWS